MAEAKTEPVKRVLRIVDVETSGLDPAIHRVVEIATVDLIWHSDGEITHGESWSSLINPGLKIPPDSSAIHDITDEMVADAPVLDTAMGEHIKRGPPDAFCAHNSRFDSSFFKPAGIPWLDTYRIALWLWPDSPNHTNACLRYYLNLKFADDIGPRHRAAGDAYITAAILRRAILRGATFEQMMEVSNRPAFLPKFHFGMHAMKPIAEVPESYLNWILLPAQKSMDEDTRFTAFEELNRRRSEGSQEASR